MKSVISFLVTGFVLVLILFGVYSLVGIPVGTFLDWLIGIIAIMWLFLIVTVPWNAHFKAREILDEAEISKRKNILVIESSLDFAKRIAKRSLWIAIGLHAISAITLYILALLNITPIGYVGAIVAALLAFFRPSVRIYEYIQTRLASIREEFRYPRQDINELLADIQDLKSSVKEINSTLTDDPEQSSWRQEIDKFVIKTNENIDKLRAEAENDRVKAAEIMEGTVQKLEAEIVAVKQLHLSDMQRIAVDSQILDSVRTLAQFVKQMKM